MAKTMIAGGSERPRQGPERALTGMAPVRPAEGPGGGPDGPRAPTGARGAHSAAQRPARAHGAMGCRRTLGRDSRRCLLPMIATTRHSGWYVHVKPKEHSGRVLPLTPTPHRRSGGGVHGCARVACMCARARICVRACARACAYMCARMHAHTREHVFTYVQPQGRLYPYCPCARQWRACGATTNEVRRSPLRGLLEATCCRIWPALSGSVTRGFLMRAEGRGWNPSPCTAQTPQGHRPCLAAPGRPARDRAWARPACVATGDVANAKAFAVGRTAPAPAGGRGMDGGLLRGPP